MIPTLLELGPIPIRSFGLMVALALIVGSIRLAKSFPRYGIAPELAERYVMVAGISGIVGARIWYLVGDWERTRLDLTGALFSSAGFTFYGGFIIAAIAVLFTAKRDGTKLSALCDALGPCLAVGYAIGRLGCQLSGDGDYGIPTNGFWGMSYSTGVVPTLPGELVYPTPLFESAIAVGVLYIVSQVEKSTQVLTAPMQRFGLYLALISIERFSVEFLRGNEKMIANFSEAQMIGATFAVIGGVLLLAPRLRRAADPATH